jgi:hypothetical protein
MITVTFEEVFTFENIYKAHMRGRSCKRSKKQLVNFEMTMLAHLYDLYEKINNGTFRISKYKTFIVYEPKRREVQTLEYPIRIIQHVICDDVLLPYLSKRTILDNAVCIKGRGPALAAARFEDRLREYVHQNGPKGYFLKCDILKYFASIPHQRVKDLFCSQIQDTRLRNLIIMFIDSYHTSPQFLDKYSIPYTLDENGNTNLGLPIGNQTSPVFGMFYLDVVDRLFKERYGIKVYSRYMDDFVVVVKNKKFLIFLLQQVKEVVAQCGLILNDKTQIFPLTNGVTYLGYRFRVTESGQIIKTVKKMTKRRFRKRASLLKKAYLDGIIDSERVRSSLSAFHGCLVHAKSFKIEKELFKKLYNYAYPDGMVKRKKKKQNAGK